MAELKALKAQRGQIKGQVTRILTFFKMTGKKGIAEAQVCLRRLEELWDAYEQIQSKIEVKPAAAEDEDR